MSILADRLPGARVLDLFAGSGALGLEALSRGAATATFIELAGPSVAAIRTNAAALGLASRVQVFRRDALPWLRRAAEGELGFDLAFADPPYQHDAAVEVARRFRERPFASLLGIEHPARQILAGGETRRYGDVALTFYFAP